MVVIPTTWQRTSNTAPKATPRTSSVASTTSRPGLACFGTTSGRASAGAEEVSWRGPRGYNACRGATSSNEARGGSWSCLSSSSSEETRSMSGLFDDVVGARFVVGLLEDPTWSRRMPTRPRRRGLAIGCGTGP